MLSLNQSEILKNENYSISLWCYLCETFYVTRESVFYYGLGIKLLGLSSWSVLPLLTCSMNLIYEINFFPCAFEYTHYRCYLFVISPKTMTG